MAGDWTDEESDAIVADYFAMLAHRIPVVKLRLKAAEEHHRAN